MSKKIIGITTPIIITITSQVITKNNTVSLDSTSFCKLNQIIANITDSTIALARYQRLFLKISM